MSIESKIPTEEINIKDLTLEKPETEMLSGLPFDQKRDIHDADWKAIEAQMEYLKEENIWHNFIELAYDMRVLNPKFNCQIPENFWEEAVKYLKETNNNTRRTYVENTLQLVGRLELMAVLDPVRSSPIISLYWRNMEIALEEFRRHNLLNFSTLARSMKIMNPQFDLQIDADMLKEIKKVTVGDTSTYLSYKLSTRKIIDPNFEADVTNSEWHVMRKELDDERGKNQSWINFALIAADMKILAADKVNIPSPGVIELEMSTEHNLKTAITPIPEIKKF